MISELHRYVDELTNEWDIKFDDLKNDKIRLEVLSEN